MGFMTEISILNDNFHKIEADPEKWLRDVRTAMNDHPYGPRTYVMGQTTVHPSHHADDPRVYIAERNGFYDIGEYGIESFLFDSLADDSHLDFYESEIDKAIKTLKDSKRYVQYLREEVGFEERPGQKDYKTINDHHIRAWRWRKKKASKEASSL